MGPNVMTGFTCRSTLNTHGMAANMVFWSKPATPPFAGRRTSVEVRKLT